MQLRESISLIFKGIGMGAANVIPGVSGGTIALITGIFEKLINSIKSFDLKAVRLILKGDFKGFFNHVNMGFLVSVFSGIFISILTLAKILGYLFENYPIYIWAYFFGLILASVYFVGRRIEKVDIRVVVTFIAGTLIAVLLSVLNPATENTHIYYLVLCGVVAICSMILPGLSGSFVLILMGNYELIFIQAVNEFNLGILIPVGVGVVLGLLAFSHILSWIFKRYKDQTISLLTGFILGSLSILWPWKNEVYQTNPLGDILLKSGGDPVVIGYEKYLPQQFDNEVIFSILLMIAGIITIWVIERYADLKKVE
jgi:putative membrane protein